METVSNVRTTSSAVKDLVLETFDRASVERLRHIDLNELRERVARLRRELEAAEIALREATGGEV